MSKSGKSSQHINWWMVVPTSVLAVAAILGIILSQCNVSHQLEQARQSTKRQWRPYLITSQIDWTVRLAGLMGEIDTERRSKPLEEISRDSAEFLAVNYIGVELLRKLQHSNNGKTPLILTASLASTVTSDEWRDKYFSSYEILVDSIRRFEVFDSLPSDVVILPGHVLTFNDRIGVRRKLSKSEFVRVLDSSGSLIAYPYVYVEYSDIFGNSYNAIRVERAEIEIETDSTGYFTFPDTSDHPRLEKYRWDVSLED